MVYGSEYWARTAGLTTGALSVTADRGRLYSIFFVNTSGADFYIQAFDKATTPTTGDVSIIPPVVVYNDAYGGINFPEGMRFTTGLQIRITTAASYAGDAAALATNTAGGLVGWSGIP
jgi:hypothetical protein